ncbi:hypothetical protein DL95DRAFT_387513 [Leptodontidium sp. 2 PMI_412]|nr:hypothetical protein DL95DRAFT_387513 [Leptodontidium sp. 2 PMI_412]
MCDFEEFNYNCSHQVKQLLSYCHFARTDPFHQCFGVQVTKNTWHKNFPCPACEEAERQRAWAEEQERLRQQAWAEEQARNNQQQ